MRIKISNEVIEAIKNNKPVVALESTIISHGMPYPENVKTALKVEETVRKCGAIPATIGIIDGTPVVGMSKEEIELFGKTKGVLKVSRRDLPYVIAKGLWGATTVATTMIFANMAGIKVFVTGGIGGVHRGAEVDMDISADLQELSNTSVCVVCAGIKAILDLSKTLEYLETMGVTVLGYKSSNLADFYTPDSGLKLDFKVDDPKEIAECILVKDEMKLKGGILVSNPIPEEEAIDKNVVNAAISLALKEANDKNIKGKDITPFLLRRVSELTNGDSLKSNIALILNNAKLGAKVACEYASLLEE